VTITQLKKPKQASRNLTQVIDKTGADLLFQVISLRYEHGAIIITSNRAFKEWPTVFNHDSTLTAAILDRLLHHAETVIIEGKSCRMKDQIEG
jgi:DNA replication protein DnaC